MEEQIARIEKHIATLQADRQNAARMVEACDNCIYTAQMILDMLRDGSPLSSEQQQLQPQANGQRTREM